MRTIALLCFVVVILVIGEISAAAACTPGEKKNEDCNVCTCTNTGVFACTRRQCGRRRRSPAECALGETKIENCNNCQCTASGDWACTRNICKTKRDSNQVCEPNSSFKKDCNTCKCTPDGKNAICTLAFCL